uniref:EOG090X0FVK n=1 Tax=Lynceus sp. MCZ IZ 141354 TaxID=1930659 RepID=A0A9N6WUZ6_9CRUS|nr:EOG090X0FVK [Lynceus sp. MCZ IZ 141354]
MQHPPSGLCTFHLFVKSSYEKLNVFFTQNGQIHWKNSPAKKNEAYAPTQIEQLANIATHGACILPSVFATWHMTSSATTSEQYFAGLIFGLALIALFTVSACFHWTCLCRMGKLRDAFHRGDRAMIYIFIAASYFPWVTLLPRNHSATCHDSYFTLFCDYLVILASEIGWIVWAMALGGVIYQQLFHEKYKWLETFLYIMVGFLPSLTLLHNHEIEGLYYLKAGGLCYFFGVFFFKADGRIPLAHALWHLCVAAGSATHYYAVVKYLMGPQHKIQHS